MQPSCDRPVFILSITRRNRLMLNVMQEKMSHNTRLVFCILCIVSTAGLLKTDAELDNLTGIGTGVMLFANLPIIWLLGRQAMRAYKDYIRRLDDGRIGAGHEPPSLEDLISGRDVEK